jgi:hypothetical protein
MHVYMNYELRTKKAGASQARADYLGSKKV